MSNNSKLNKLYRIMNDLDKQDKYTVTKLSNDVFIVSSTKLVFIHDIIDTYDGVKLIHNYFDHRSLRSKGIFQLIY